MSSRLEIQQKSSNNQAMLCPCCGGSLFRAARQCACGARFVGEPLDETPIKVQRLGPAFTAVVLLIVVVSAALIATKWLAFAGLLVIWSAWRAVRLARQDPGWYGGYKTAAATLAVTSAACAVLAAYGLAHIPQALDNYATRQRAATHSAMYHVWDLLEESKRAALNASYPRDAQEYKRVIGESLPTDYWDRTIKYQSFGGAVADSSTDKTVIQFPHFELRSAGPDGIAGTNDDIIMRDGTLFTNAEIKNQPAVQQLR